MKEFVKRLIGRLEEEVEYQDEKANEAGVFDTVSESHTRISMRNCYEHAIKIVNQLAEEYNNGWIPCSERLPEKYGEYLCCDTYGNFVLGFPSESDTSDTGFIVETEHEYCYDIIAWMPLPEPYKKGEDK